MMNTETLILTHLKAFPGQTPAQLSSAIGRSIKTVYGALPDMICRGEIWRDEYCRYFTTEPAGAEDTKFSRLSDQAFSLQDRGYWNRAAKVWLDAMHSTAKDGLREKACALRKHCIEMANLSRPQPAPDPLWKRGNGR
jgi:hypothetical protein